MATVVLFYFRADEELAQRVASLVRRRGWTVILIGDDSPREAVQEFEERSLLSSVSVLLLWTRAAAAATSESSGFALTMARQLMQTDAGDGVEALLFDDAELPLILGDIPAQRVGRWSRKFLTVLAGRFPRQPRGHVSMSLRSVPAPYKRDAQANRIFISYSTCDFQCAQLLSAQVANMGLPVWFAPSDMGAHAHWTRQIYDAIQTCRAFVLLTTIHSLGSPHCLREAILAMEEQKKMVLLCHGAAEVTADWRYPLAGLQRVSWNCTSDDAQGVLNALAHV